MWARRTGAATLRIRRDRAGLIRHHWRTKTDVSWLYPKVCHAAQLSPTVRAKHPGARRRAKLGHIPSSYCDFWEGLAHWPLRPGAAFNRGPSLVSAGVAICRRRVRRAVWSAQPLCPSVSLGSALSSGVFVSDSDGDLGILLVTREHKPGATGEGACSRATGKSLRENQLAHDGVLCLRGFALCKRSQGLQALKIELLDDSRRSRGIRRVPRHDTVERDRTWGAALPQRPGTAMATTATSRRTTSAQSGIRTHQ